MGDINQSLRLFWEIENIKFINTSLTIDDQRAEDYYKTTTIRTERYSVILPFQNKPDLGNSYNAALKRLKSMERKFKSDLNFKDAYCEFMREYISLSYEAHSKRRDKTSC